MTKNGRPTALTAQIQKEICSALAAGGFLETAIALAGVPKSTFYDWLKRGSLDKSGIYKDFSDSIKRALAVAETKYVSIIGGAAKTQWQAAAWILERRFPQKWAKASGLSSPVSTGQASTPSSSGT